MQELIEAIDSLLSRLSEQSREKESLEWYLHNNLVDYKSALQCAETRQEIENATRALIRFCTESMDWDNELFRACTAITNQGIRIAKKA
jgi:hypothetical protein